MLHTCRSVRFIRLQWWALHHKPTQAARTHYVTVEIVAHVIIPKNAGPEKQNETFHESEPPEQFEPA